MCCDYVPTYWTPRSFFSEHLRKLSSAEAVCSGCSHGRQALASRTMYPPAGNGSRSSASRVRCTGSRAPGNSPRMIEVGTVKSARRPPRSSRHEPPAGIVPQRYDNVANRPRASRAFSKHCLRGGGCRLPAVHRRVPRVEGRRSVLDPHLIRFAGEQILIGKRPYALALLPAEPAEEQIPNRRARDCPGDALDAPGGAGHRRRAAVGLNTCA